ncbi:MAG: NAD(P)-dependent oxidoreductase [Rhodospirillaceae bacterium]|jgi:nucleoside-diphosphate-sugar epimerase|nr:NAD(P)-dependent oxidoreductase [Rhodospirillaceae bacterium]MBT5195013.1 NAD(P)-dependent oxidoreductase [Rhodospirillaceae bacterium]MBT5894711.1 NAD(P)-dependent oxidoreductase [Rhodospirillaceae bacterium]MBT6429118.1 NAD(P)-dependent oxidoreductase [Rhodospirillaceae bacterium]
MSILAIGGAGFIGRRMIPILAAAGHEVTCMDIDVAGAKAAFGHLGDKVKVVRGDVTQFDDVIGAVQETRAERVINLSYFIGDLAPHIAFKLDIQGMDNCFEAARRCGVKHTVFASSVAVSGPQTQFGDRLVDETDERHGDSQYAVNKIINEWQAHDYRRAYDMTITCIRPANVTGPDKKFGSIDHVNCMCQPARGQSVTFSHADTMRCVIHVEDMAEVFARVALADKPKFETYNSGGATVSLAELAGLVREFLPDADIRFEAESGGRDLSGNYMIGSSRVVEEFSVQYAPLRQRVKEVINDIRAVEGQPPLA